MFCSYRAALAPIDIPLASLPSARLDQRIHPIPATLSVYALMTAMCDGEPWRIAFMIFPSVSAYSGLLTSCIFTRRLSTGLAQSFLAARNEFAKCIAEFRTLAALPAHVM
jgi:hypothetical protein